MTGLYRFVVADWPILVSAGQGVLLVRSYYEDDFDFELTPVGANRFLFNGNVPFEFMPATAGKPKQWRIVDSPRNDQGCVPAGDVRAVARRSFRSYVGDYHSDEIGVTFTIESARLHARPQESRLGRTSRFGAFRRTCSSATSSAS